MTRPTENTPPSALTEAEEASKRKGRYAMSPEVNAAAVMEPYLGNVVGKDADLMEVIDGLRATFKRSEQGSLADLENMLISQAVALQTMFASLARRAQNQDDQKNLHAFLTLAFKAQSQSRATIQALAELKYPRQVAFVNQANISHGPQQVNNGPLGTCIPARENQLMQNELLEESHHGSTHLDRRATPKAGRGYTEMEAVEAVDRTNQRKRKGSGLA